MTALNDNQKQDIAKLKKTKVGALFMEPGTGKTRTAIELVKSTDTDFVLWIVPFQTKTNLQDEIKKWGMKQKYEIVGVESIGASDRIYMETLEKLKHYHKAFIVVDESLKIKNSLAKRTQRVINLGKYSTYRLILNGTPLSKNILDLYSQMKFLSPLILNMDIWDYQNKFCVYKKVSGDNIRTRTYISGYANMEYLYSLIEPYVFEAKLNLNVGSKVTDYDYDVDHPRRYLELKEKLIDSIDFMSDTAVLGMFQEMQQSYSLDSGKLDEMDFLMENIIPQPDKTIIFCKFIKTKEELQKRYPKSLVMTYGKGTLGLNLQTYKYMVFYDKIWNYALLEQAKR